MKKGIHPENYRLVAFKDMSNDHVFLCRSAVSTKETIEVNGETYPVYKMEISNTSHPFYTGKMKLVDTAGRVDKFMSRYAKRYDKKGAKQDFPPCKIKAVPEGAAFVFTVFEPFMPECHVADNADFPRVVKIFEQGIVFIFIFASREANNNLNLRKL